MEYKEKLEEAKKLYESANDDQKYVIESLFPEVKKNKMEWFEKIRQELKSYLGHREVKQISEADAIHQWIAWLEKQGEQKPTLPKWKYKNDNTPLLRDSLILNKYGCVAKSPSGAIVSDVWVIDYDELTKLPKEELERQGEQETLCDKCRKEHPSHSCQDITELGRCAVEHEQKSDNSYCQENCKGFQETGKCFADGDCKAKREAESVDEVKPKFKVGDKVYNIKNRLECTIESIDDTVYYCDTTNFDIKYQNNWELVEYKPADKVEPKFRVGDTMRTLQEANDGYTDGMPVVVSIDNEYYHCTNELIAIKDQDDYEFPPINVKQKPADKVEPKFKVDDWIVKENIVYHIDKISGVYLTLSTIDGTALVYHKNVLNNYKIHLWDISDAKDGDVLATSTGAFIYNGNNGGGSCPGSYCGINTLGNFKVGVEHHWTGKPVIPATKEQRDLLFTKMKEAGYEWDSKKKELKKIDTYCQENCKGFQETGKCFCDGECKAKKEHDKQNLQNNNFSRIKQKTAEWSENDDYNVQCLIAKVTYDIQKGNIGRNQELIDWLKTLKHRMNNV